MSDQKREIYEQVVEQHEWKLCKWVCKATIKVLFAEIDES